MTKEEAREKVLQNLLELKKKRIIEEWTYEIWASIDEGYKYYKGYVFYSMEVTIDDTSRRVYITDKEIRYQCNVYNLQEMKPGTWKVVKESNLR